jgi:4a-hydroxytetrahydrobiopterin dehydratase
MGKPDRDRVLPGDEIAARLAAELPHWQHAEGTIRRTYRTAGWKGTLMVVNAIGHLAELAWHHPDLLVGYASVEVRLSTHSAKGITALDLALARKIEDVVLWRPGLEAGPFDGIPTDPRFSYIVYDE